MGEGEEKWVSTLVMKKTDISIAEASSRFPGFRFSPTDGELLGYYLKKKLEGSDQCVEVIPEVDICKDEPWDLPAKSVIQSENEWFFFSPRGKKYPNGSQSKRATQHGYWKATGKKRTVKSGSTVVGTKRTLVFHTGRAPKGQRTEWIMHEYCMSGKSQDLMSVCRLRKNSEFFANYNSGRKSVVRTVSSSADNHATALSGGIDQMGTCEGAFVVGSCSKECSSSYTSQSVEQLESGFQSGDKVPDEVSHDSSSNQKDSDGHEDDCFADIMDDDIIKLDESSFSPSPPPQRIVARESESKNSEQPAQVSSPTQPPQGMANRRLRLRIPRRKRHEAEQVGNSKTKEPMASRARKSPKRSLGWFPSIGAKRWVKMIFIILIMLLLLYPVLDAFGVISQAF